MGTDQLYYNNGTIISPPQPMPQIDALNFLNDGTFDLFTTLPFDTSSTLNFTNNGTMIGSVGFRFDNAPPNSGQRKLASTFINRVRGTIQATDDLGVSYLFVTATNIFNRGLLEVGANGWLQLVGTNLDLSRGGLEVTPIPPGRSFGIGTNFFADAGIIDEYWAQANMQLDSSSLLSGFGTNIIARWPLHQVQGPGGGFGFIPSVSLFNPVSDFISSTNGGIFLNLTNIVGNVTTNVFIPTNIIRQAAFVDVSGASNMTAQIRWSDSSSPTNRLKTVSVQLAVPITNVVTATSVSTTIYFVDRLAGETNRGLTFNASAYPFTFRPAPYSISRGMPTEFAAGFAGLGAVTNTTFLYDPAFTNAIVNAAYAAYEAFVDSVVSEPTNFPGGTVTNQPGRINIYANSLDLSRARLQGLGLVRIQADNLVSSSNAVVDSESLSYDLSSATGTVRIQNLARESVERLKGPVAAWSGLWTNRLTIVIENYRTNNTGTGPNWILAPITTNAQVLIHALILDAAALVTQQPVTVYTLNTHSANTVVDDAMTVVQSLLFDGLSLTLNGRLTLSETEYANTAGDQVRVALDNWVFTNAPNLRFFTNNGTFIIPNEAHFGDDGPAPYVAFVNNGAIYANGQSINSDYCEIRGQHIATASISVTSRAGEVAGGRLTAGADAHFFGNVMKFAHSTISAGRQLDLSVTDSLYDDGGGASNVWICGDGFRLNLKPQTGDLLGTAIQTKAPTFAEVDHFWAGADRGATIEGYANNAALGRLTLVPQGFDPLFVFSGTASDNGLYVDYLDLSQLSDYANQLQIDPNLVIYFAAAKLGFTPPLTNGVPQQPEEYLDGQFGGHLRWVRSFAGPNSSVDVVINGQTATVNRALRFSRSIDSDGDGIPNYYDLNPFDQLLAKAALVKTNAPPSGTLGVSWEAVPQAVYQVEFTTNLPPANWQVLLKYTNNTPALRTVTVLDTNAPVAGSRRFYRVGRSP
jgi:hypothetical protein